MASDTSPRKRPEPPFDGHEHMEPPGLESEVTPRPQYRAPYYKGSDKLRDRVALITGGDSGIGRATAVLFAREGANVAIVCLPEEQSDADETVRAIEDEGRECHVFTGDIRDRECCERAVQETIDRFGDLHILVNNAAFQNHVDLDELSLDQWKRTLDTNLTGMFQMTMAALPHLDEGGCIINTGSVTGLEGSAGLLDYSTTKGGIHAFTKTLAQMVADRGIRVNCVAPGPVWTPLNPAERDPDSIESFGENTPFGRPGQPEEIAPAYVYFASDQMSGWVSGEVLTLLGGATRAG